MSSDPRTDRLAPYRSKRTADRTPEPFGEGAIGGGGRFVVQKHAARRLHYDLRLEHAGVLMSWAVPAGISLDPAEKRFAAHTEDHPLDYADFEGVIPEGEYGAGGMIVWDRGAVTFAEDPGEGLESGKLLFDLFGYKVNGRWTLVRMKDPKEWLLIKKPDAWSRTDAEFDETSVLSGATIEEVVDGSQARRHAVLEAIAGAPEGTVPGVEVDLMLARVADGAFSRPGWIFEIKYDGYRMVATKDGRTVHLRYRSGLDATAVFPDVAAAVRRLPFDSVTLDGEVVVLDAEGRPSFSDLQRRGRLSNRHQIAVASVSSPATFFAFDLLAVEGFDVRPLALLKRKAALRIVMPTLGPLRFADHIAERGREMFGQVEALGLEGVMAKDGESPYVGGRSDRWLKVRADRIGTFAVIGFTAPKGSRTGIGSLHVAYGVPDGLHYAGRVGSGISEAELGRLWEALVPHAVGEPSIDGAPDSGDSTWVVPTLQCTIRYKDITPDGVLRQPVYLSSAPLDTDAVLVFESEGSGAHEPPLPIVVDARTLEPTNPDKVFWPDDGYTKGDLIDYYTAVADRLLPWLVDRPLVMDRFPDGIDGSSFFQKNAPEFVPDWIRTEWIERGDGSGNRYLIVEDVEALRYVANLASIPLHVWASRVARLDSPDWCVLDLDPKGAPFISVVAIAREIREVANAMGLPSRVKTSGKTGLHVLLPMGEGSTFDQQRLLGELIARLVEIRMPELATTARMPNRREGKVYIDYLQNGRGKLLVTPYSVRPVPGATVSAPLRWREVVAGLDPARFTIRSMPRRIAAMKDDPLAPILTEQPDIAGGLRRLATLLGT